MNLIVDQPEKALPIVLSFHEKHKDNSYLAGLTYYNLIVAYYNLGEINKAKQIIKEGIKKFPKNKDFLNFRNT